MCTIYTKDKKKSYFTFLFITGKPNPGRLELLFYC